MSPTPPPAPLPSRPALQPSPPRPAAAIVALAGAIQLLIVFAPAIMDIALPAVQRDLAVTTDDVQWVISAYALSFVSLLPLCGRLADLIGRKAALLTGLAGFAVASAAGGLSSSFVMLVTAVACQGAFAALLAPPALSLVTSLRDPKQRARALGVFGAVMAGGAGLAVPLGGWLTAGLTWRWCLYVSVVFAAIVIAAVALLLDREPRAPGARLDAISAAAVSAGMLCLAYGLSNVAAHGFDAPGYGWGTPSTWGFLALGVALLILFAFWQSRAGQPLLPSRVLLDRNRGGAYLALVIIAACTLGSLPFLLYYLQAGSRYSPLSAGLALLPMFALAGSVACLGSIALLPRSGPRPLAIAGMLCNAAGLAWLAGSGTHSGYASALGPLLVTGAGMGLVYALAPATGTFSVAPPDAGIASASVQAGPQAGALIGNALLTTVAASAATSYLASQPQVNDAQLVIHEGIPVFWWCAGICVAGAAVCGALLRRGRLGQPGGRPAGVAQGPAGNAVKP